MKKLLFLILFVTPLLFISCATTNNTDDISDSELNFENTENLSENTDTIEENESLDLSSDIDKEPETVAELYPELEDIVEPEITTLEPEEITTSQETAEDNESEILELVEADLPSEEPIATINTQTQDEIETNEQDHSNPKLEINEAAIADFETLQSSDDSVIDITDDDNSATEEIKTVDTPIVPSRKVTMKLYEYLDVTYPGSGWIFMGLTDNSKDLSYYGKKLSDKDSKYTLQARNPGTKIIHFYKEDLIKNEYIDDYIEVEILKEKGLSKTHITAPAYKQAISKKSKKIIEDNEKIKSEKIETQISEDDNIKNQTADNKSSQTSPSKTTVNKEEKTSQKQQTQTSTSVQNKKEEKITTDNKKTEEENISEPESYTKSPDQNIDSNVLLKEAQLLYNEKEYKAAKDKIEIFLEIATNKTDEGLYLKGQILEAKSEIQNIKAAINAYTTLTKNYPGSRYWDDANKRIIYLKRFYMEVR